MNWGSRRDGETERERERERRKPDANYRRQQTVCVYLRVIQLADEQLNQADPDEIERPRQSQGGSKK